MTYGESRLPVVIGPAVIERLRRASAGAWRFLANCVRTPAARERAIASGVFALIFVGFVGGVDYVITGGPTWNPGGAPPELVVAPRALVSASEPVLVGYAPPPAPLLTQAIDLGDYPLPIEDLLGGPGSDFRAASFDPYLAYGERVAASVTGKVVEANAF